MTEQTRLIKAILSQQPNNEFESHGLEIYRRNLLANAKRALKISFPISQVLMGDELFEHVCRQFLITNSPRNGDWGSWGAGLWEVITTLPQMYDFPYVANVAELDFARHNMERLELSVVNMNSFQLLAEQNLDHVYLVLNEDVFIKKSLFPIVDIYKAHDGQQINQVFLEKAKKGLKNDVGQIALMFRKGFKAQITEISEVEHAWLDMILKRKSLGKALDELLPIYGSEFSLETWLPMALEKNLISHLEL